MCRPPVATSSDNFAKLSYSVINYVLTNLLPADLQDFFLGAQRLKSDEDSKQAVGVLPDRVKSGLFGDQFCAVLYHHLLTYAF